MFEISGLLEIIKTIRIIKPWKLHHKEKIVQLESNFTFWSVELDKSLIMSEEIGFLNDDRLLEYRDDLTIIYNDIKDKYSQYKSYFLSNGYNPDYENILVRMYQLFLRADREIRERKFWREV